MRRTPAHSRCPLTNTGELPHGPNQDGATGETYNPWSIVNLVFHHLAEQGLHPVLGESGDPGRPGRGAAPGAGHRAGRRG